MTQDPFAELKQRQRAMWASFTPTAIFTTPVAAHLVRFAGIARGESVLDGGHFGDPFFERGTMSFPALSLAHYRLFMERAIGPLQKVVESLADAPDKLSAMRAEYETLAQPYYADNVVHQSYILTRAHVR